MTPVGKALWFIESHFTQELSLEAIAAVSGVSRYHIAHVFSLATGLSVMRYVRGRRLTEAARALVNGAPDILTVALDVGYGSHEAFTRAFREQFGITPEQLRASGTVNDITLVEALRMDDTPLTTLTPARCATLGTLFIAGLGERYTTASSAGIPAQWQRFVPHLGHIPGQKGHTTYGVLCNSDDEGNIEYVCGVEVVDFSDLPAHWSRLRIPAQMYAVFTHAEHVSTIRRTWFAIWNTWLPASGYEVAEAPAFERYGDTFNPMTGNGGVEIWLPVTKQ